MARADAGAIQAVKAKLDLVDVVQRYVDLRMIGGRWAGPCPFHQETKPSFYVHPEQGFYHCFGCQASGDVIDFYRRINGLEFKDALTQLAAEAGVELGPARPVDPEEKKRRELERVCREMHQLSADYFHKNLGAPRGSTARLYLEGRGTSPEIIERFKLGCSLDDWQGLHTFLQSKGYAPEQGAQAGLLSRSDKTGRIYDRFRNRLMFPIVSLSGQIVAFGGRVLGAGGENDPKYLNSSDSPIYKKGEHLYGLYQARQHISKSKRALLTEGYMDVLTLHQFGYAEAVGVLGTALTPEQVKRLSGFCVEVGLLFDGDAPGRKAALRSCEMILGQGLKCRVVMLPEGEDVDSLLQKQGKDAFEACLTNAADGLDFCLETVRGIGSPREIVNWARNFLKGLKDPAWRSWYLPRLAEGLGLAEAEFRRSLFEAVPAGPQAQSAERSGGSSQASQRPAPQTGPQFGLQSGKTGEGQANVSPRFLFDRKPFGEREAASGRLLREFRVDAFDRRLLAMAVTRPDRAPVLAEMGADQVFRSERAQAFWNKLVTLDEAEIFVHLDDEEKRFFTEHRMLEPPDEETAAEEWRDICQRLEESTARLAALALRESLGRASDHGEALEILKSLHDSLRRRDE